MTALFTSLAVLALLSGCNTPEETTKQASPIAPSPLQSAPLAARAVLTSASGSKVQGVVNFFQKFKQLRVEAKLTGLSPGEHGFHIHENGDCLAPDALSFSRRFSHLKLKGDASILGEAIIVHEKADDLKSRPSVDAGGRVACGIIEKK